VAYSDDHDDEQNSKSGKDGAFYPPFTIFESEPHLKHIAHELGVVREFLTDAGTCGAVESTIRR
jgi:hypothetical protein